MRIFGTLGAVDESTRSVEILASTPAPVDGEALVSWDLERFIKNPVILWSHDPNCLPVGKADNVRFDSDGLKMRVTFASADANPHAEQLWNSVKEQTVRTVSVGFEPGKASTKTVEGKKVTVRSANVLLETSFVSIPKDEDAGVITPSQAASVLSRSRAVARTDAELLPDGFVYRCDDVGERLAKFQRTATGGAIIPARIARTGILHYMQPDGTVRREYRPADEVFKADSLASLDRVPVIDFIDHRALVTPETYTRTTRGSSTGGRRDGKYITADLYVEDRATLDAIESGERADISAGYVCRLDFTPGTFEGEPYDAVQRDIRFNHVALCPPNRGRSGPDVALRLDSKEGTNMKTIRLDGVDYEYGSEQHLAKVDSIHQAKVTELQKRVDAAEGEKDQAKEESRKLREEVAGEKKNAEDERKKRESEDSDKIRQRVRLYRTALRLLETGSEEDDEKKKDDDKERDGETEDERSKREADLEKKMDAMGDREIMLMAIQAHSKDFKADGKSVDYIRSRFDALDESNRENRRVGGVARAAVFHQTRVDSKDEKTEYEKAVERRDKAAADAWKTPAKR